MVSYLRLWLHKEQAAIRTVVFAVFFFVWKVTRKIDMSFLAISFTKKNYFKIVPPKSHLAIFVTVAFVLGTANIRQTHRCVQFITSYSNKV